MLKQIHRCFAMVNSARLKILNLHTSSQTYLHYNPFGIECRPNIRLSGPSHTQTSPRSLESKGNSLKVVDPAGGIII